MASKYLRCLENMLILEVNWLVVKRKNPRKNPRKKPRKNLPKEKQRRKVAGGIYSKNKPVSIEQYQK
jgi:hypothetical protein